MKTNLKSVSTAKTHEGARGVAFRPDVELRRAVASCMLWEDGFYESGENIAERIASLVAKCDPAQVASLAVEARSEMNLRHVPLLLCRELAKTKGGRAHIRGAIRDCIQRADELAEFVSIYWKDGKKPLAAQVKLGLADAFAKFSEYDFAKYDRSEKVKLRDVLFLCHAKPENEARAELYKRIANRQLITPDTWEVELSKGAGVGKKASWERLLSEKKLGALALLRNLRNMDECGVDSSLVRNSLSEMDVRRVLPFRFVAAAKAAPKFEDAIDSAFLRNLAQQPKLYGKTIVIIDVSGSMYGAKLSAKSDMDRAQAACALGAICREICQESVIFATAGDDSARVHKTELVPSRRGMALVDAIYAMCLPLGGGGIFLKQAMDYVLGRERIADRTIVITDEQDCDINNKIDAQPIGTGYIINVATDKHGVSYGPWNRVSGFSEAVIRWIVESEKNFTYAKKNA